MKRLIALLALVAVALSAEAQEGFSFSKADDYTFGKITKEDLLKNDYPIDSSADAVVLDEYVRIMPSMLDIDSYVYRGRLCPMIIREVVARKIKILTDKGVANKRISIPLKNNSTTDCENCEPYSVRAYSYTLKNNRVVKRLLKVENINRREEADGTSYLEFDVPNVEKGSIIEYGYTKAIITPNLYYIKGMREDMPKLNSRYMVVLNNKYAEVFTIEPLADDMLTNDDKIKFDDAQANESRAERRMRTTSSWSGPKGGMRETHYDEFVAKTYEVSTPATIESGAGVKVTVKTNK